MSTYVEGGSARKRVFLHVGSPKTGTTFLQEVLWRQKDLAAEQGLLLPMRSFFDHYLATLDVRGLADRPPHPPRAAGMWKAMVDEALRWRGDVLISHELFAGASQEQAEAAVASFPDTVDVHVVVSARDLGRQVPAEWQEHVKHRATQTFPQFVATLRRERPGAWFWQVQDYPQLLRRWGAGLPSDRLHVVTVPQAGTDPSTLWSRFAGLVGLRPEAFDLEGLRANTSLGYEQAELLRRVNLALGDRLPMPGPYPVDVKDFFAQSVLAGRPGTRFALGGDDLAWARERSLRIVEELKQLGADVVGDLAELVPEVEEREQPDLEAALHADRLLEESVAAIATLLTERRERRAEVESLRHTLATGGEAPLTLRRLVRQRLVALSERSALAGRARVAYRHARERSHRSGDGR